MIEDVDVHGQFIK